MNVLDVLISKDTGHPRRAVGYYDAVPKGLLETSGQYASSVQTPEGSHRIAHSSAMGIWRHKLMGRTFEMALDV
ncbi:MAG: hypothetical protein WC647_02525 [Desulfomonilaceae bacterium]